MKNGIPCKTVGVGNIRIRMFDGIIRELTDVIYVPKLDFKFDLFDFIGSVGFLWI
jgi:hypothetical protein